MKLQHGSAVLLSAALCVCAFVVAQALQGSDVDRYHKLGIAQQSLYKELFHRYELKLREEEQLTKELHAVMYGDGSSAKGKSKGKGKLEAKPKDITAASQKMLVGKPLYVRKYMSLELSAAAGLALGLVGLLMGYSVGSFA